MKLRNSVAKVIAKVSVSMAKYAYGTPSRYGTCQTKEPEQLKKLFTK